MDDSDTFRLLAFVHPAWMVGTLGLAMATAKLGLEIRRLRLQGQPAGADRRRRHLRLGRLTLTAVGFGFLLGPLSMYFFRDDAVFDSFHSILGIIVVGLFAWTGWSGRALAAGDQDARDIHRLGAAGSLGAAFVSAIAGFVLLP